MHGVMEVLTQRIYGLKHIFTTLHVLELKTTVSSLNVVFYKTTFYFIALNKEREIYLTPQNSI